MSQYSPEPNENPTDANPPAEQHSETPREPQNSAGNDKPEDRGESQETEPSGSPGETGDSGDSYGDSSREKRKPRILIGSQRDPAAYRPRPGKPLEPGQGRTGDAKRPEQQPSGVTGDSATPTPPPTAEPPVFDDDDIDEDESTRATDEAFAKMNQDMADLELQIRERSGGTGSGFTRRGSLPPDLEAEFEEALGDAAVDDLLDQSAASAKIGELEPESRHMGKVAAVYGENVFVELGLREQGVVPLKLFPEHPQEGDAIEVRVVRFQPSEGLYELTLPAAAADVADWADLEEGMLVDAKVTGTNAGGLECEVNRIRGFIPVSQIDMVRVENTEQYVGQSFTCVVMEANRQRKNLVLSRRAVLEREKEQAEKLLWDSLAPGQIRDGVVRRLTDFGAFVDIGGVDGLLHVSQLAWGRVKHPSDVIQEGQALKVRVDKVDRDARRISLSYRDLLTDPWEDVDRKYPVNSATRGKVVKIMDFGAFVELEPGVEGLVHISELANKRVWRVTDVVSEGDEVDVAVLSIDKDNRRISLSMKSLLTAAEAPETEKSEKEETPEEPGDKSKKRKPQGPLKGGLGRSPGSQGSAFGLKW